MTAFVEPVDMFEASCQECGVSSGLYMSNHAACEWAATHNAENHGENGTTDEDYERFKEARDE